MFIYFSIGSNWDVSLSKVQFQKISKPLGRTLFVINKKENNNPSKCTKINKNLKYFMKSRSTSSNEAEATTEVVLKLNLL